MRDSAGTARLAGHAESAVWRWSGAHHRLRDSGWPVVGWNGCIKNSVHYVADEQPEAVAQLIERYASLWRWPERDAKQANRI